MATQRPSISLRDQLGVLLRDNRWFIAFELLLVVLLVVLPLQSKFLFLLLFGWLSLWLRRSNWIKLGMNQPSNWWRTLSVGLGISAIYQLFSISILVPLLDRLTRTSLDLSRFVSLRGNYSELVLMLIVSWTIAAFGEEMVYRGYVLNRLADLFRNNQAGWGIGVIISSVFFGVGHFYQGVVGIAETFMFGIAASCLYLTSERNLWLPIIFHGMNDTIGFLLIFLGLYP